MVSSMIYISFLNFHHLIQQEWGVVFLTELPDLCNLCYMLSFYQLSGLSFSAHIFFLDGAHRVKALWFLMGFLATFSLSFSFFNRLKAVPFFGDVCCACWTEKKKISKKNSDADKLSRVTWTAHSLFRCTYKW